MMSIQGCNGGQKAGAVGTTLLANLGLLMITSTLCTQKQNLGESAGIPMTCCWDKRFWFCSSGIYCCEPFVFNSPCQENCGKLIVLTYTNNKIKIESDL